MESYIEDKKNLYMLIHQFLEESDEHNDDEIKINEGDEDEMLQFLEIIGSIGEHHHRDHNFNERMNKLLLHYKDQIKQTLPNLEIFHIFENNKKIVLFLIKNGIITISDEIYKEIINKQENNGNRYYHFFIPELETFSGEEKMRFFKDELLKESPNFFTNYEAKREEGENDSYICSLIRQDSIEEFITYLHHQNISTSSEILPSIFETNPFLIDNKITSLIEYSAFFGSIQIFQYLLNNEAKLSPSIWLYAIHSENAELIQFLESNNVPSPSNFLCLIESIKCHHNNISDYIKNNYYIDLQQNEEIISNCIKYHNYYHFENESIIDYGFFYLHFYHYDKLFELLLNKKKELIEEKMIQYPDIREAAQKNVVEVIYHYLLKLQKISDKPFQHTKIKQIVIPSSVTSIGENAFRGCSSLTQISIPSSVTSIGKYAFLDCSSLTQISIPSSVTSIGENAFRGCSSLTQITIPSSVTIIGVNAFEGCKSLKQISIPLSVKIIAGYAFYNCSSLTQILIPFSVTSILISTFSGCSSLTQITIPSSVTSIGSYAFEGCSSLTQITIPSSVTSIGNSIFSGCSSLTQITIPSSVTEIGSFTFSKCSSLTQITFEIPSSVTSIGKCAFLDCSSLTQITIPPSVTSIGSFAFGRCSSLAIPVIPPSVTSIGEDIFSNSSFIQEYILIDENEFAANW